MFKPSIGLAAALLVATPAAAAPIEYSLSGLFTPAGAAEAIAATITGTGNTVDAFQGTIEGQSASIIPLTAISLTLGGVTAKLPGSAIFFTLPAVGFVGFDYADADRAGGVIAETDDGVAYDGVSAIGPVDVGIAFAQLEIDGRIIEFTGADARFSAALVEAVPEPATWGMMIAGFALAGAAMRRRGRTNATA